MGATLHGLQGVEEGDWAAVEWHWRRCVIITTNDHAFHHCTTATTGTIHRLLVATIYAHGPCEDALLFPIGARVGEGEFVVSIFSSSIADYIFPYTRTPGQVNAFYLRKENELRLRLQTLMEKKQRQHQQQQQQANVTTSAKPVNAFALRDALLQYLEEMARVQQFVEMNATGFRKILKKWDKRSKSQTKELYITRQVDVQPCFNSEVLGELGDRASAALSELDAVCEHLQQQQQNMHDSGNVSMVGGGHSRLWSESGEVVYDWYGPLLAMMENPERKDKVEALLKTRPIPDDMRHHLLWKICAYAKPISAEMVELVLPPTSTLDVNYSDDTNERTCLHEASAGGDVGLVRFLLARGADKEAADVRGRRAMHLAAMHGHEQVVSVLLEAGAEVAPVDNDGYTPIMLALPHPLVVPRLLAAGSPITSNTPSILISSACTHGSMAIIKALLAQHVDIQVPDADGLFPIHLAARDGHVSLLRLLYQHCGDDLQRRDKYNNWLPLFYAASEGHLDVVKALLEFGCEVNVHDEDGWSPADYALWHGHVAVFDLLKQHSKPIAGKVVASSETAVATNATLADLDMLPSLELPPPIIPLFGHNWLDGKMHLEISLATDSSSPPIRLFGHHRCFNSYKVTVSLKSIDDHQSVGMPYTVILPSQEPVESFTFEAPAHSLSTCFVQFQVHPTFGTKLIGRAILLGDVIGSMTTSSTSQTSRLPLVGPDANGLVGEVNAQVSLIKPYLLSPINVTDIGTYWKATSASTSNPTSPAARGSSFVTASSLESEYRVSSVHLTRDGVPVVSSSGPTCSIANSVDVAIANLSLQELISFGSCQSLADLLKQLPESTNLWLSIHYNARHNVNILTDTVLHSVYTHLTASAQKRGIVFSSDDRAVCHAINMKQPNFAVFYEMDSASTSLKSAVKFAKTSNLLGLVGAAQTLVGVPILVNAVKEAGLLLVGRYVSSKRSGNTDDETILDGELNEDGVCKLRHTAQ